MSDNKDQIVYVPVSVKDELPKPCAAVFCLNDSDEYLKLTYFPKGYVGNAVDEWLDGHGYYYSVAEVTHWLKPIELSSLIKEHSIGFANWIQENNFRHTRDGWFNVRAKIEFKIEFFTTSELFDLYIEDLNKKL